MILLILLHKCPNNSKEHLFSRLRVLLRVFNLHANIPEKPCPTSFMKGNFPDSMFLSRVTSVGVDSYISQVELCQAMFKRLYGYLEYQNIPYPLQFGFKQKGSTNHALIQITESEGI